MNVTILNGNPDPANRGFEDYLAQVKAELQAGGHAVQEVRLRDLKIRYCTGCFGCWVNTPGECLTADDGRQVDREVIQSDWVLLASPMVMGFVSSTLKKTCDRLIPLIHPYFDVVQGEAHHRKRYARYPKLGLLLEKCGDADDEDVEITTSIFQRTALNMRSRLYFYALTSQPAPEVAHEINRL